LPVAKLRDQRRRVGVVLAKVTGQNLDWRFGERR
jgi:hypothetical protein